jgi:methylmalonyl-CoA/ethylmalonyl-CoA epimerase
VPPDAPRGTRIAHIGIAVADLEAILPFYRDVLGMPEVPLDDADGARIAGLAAGESLVELLEPATPDSPIGRFLEKRGPGIHHLCLASDDVRTDDEHLRDSGFERMRPAPTLGAGGCWVQFVHPKSAGGVLVELSEEGHSQERRE